MMAPTRGRETFDRLSRLFDLTSRLLSLAPSPALRAALRLVRNTPGLPGIGLRYCVLRALNVTSAPNVGVREGVFLFGTQGLEVGANLSIHPMCYIDATGGLKIGDDVSIAHGVTILSTTHRFERTDARIKDQGVQSMKTEIGNDCWIGAQSMILAGVQVHDGVVVAANSVVAQDVPAGSVVAGSPAKIVKNRHG